jgi:hypothetical protein
LKAILQRFGLRTATPTKPIRPSVLIFYLVIVAIFFLLAAITSSSLNSLNTSKDDRVTGAQRFIEAWLQSNEEQARTQLTSDFASFVSAHCEQGQLIKCPTPLDSSWGVFQRALYESTYIKSDSEVAIRFLVTWSHQSAWVIVLMVKEQITWHVIGWRGFINRTTSDAELVGLMHGTLHTNEFPPPE